MTFKCVTCGEVLRTEQIPTVAHNYVSESRDEPTCEEVGYDYQRCSVCLQTRTVEISALGHDHVGYGTKAATCAEEGEVTYYCSRCDDEYVATIGKDPLNHVGGTYKAVITLATAEADGVMGIYCLDCDALLSTEPIEKTGDMECVHNYQRVQTASCWSGGWDINVCAVCGETETNEDGTPVTYGWRGAAGHDYQIDKITLPNCWVGGGTYQTCADCGHEVITNWYGALGHDFGEPEDIPGNNLWQIVSCQREGCGHSEYRAKPQAPAKPAIVSVLENNTASILKNGLSAAQLQLNGKALTLVIDGQSLILSTNANNRNISGEVALGDGYFLKFDIKGNGSNIKQFEIIKR
jgi:hypothetical protein